MLGVLSPQLMTTIRASVVPTSLAVPVKVAELPAVIDDGAISGSVMTGGTLFTKTNDPPDALPPALSSSVREIL